MSSLEERNDGYTRLFKNDAAYSGFGWDEYANETVGIQSRLIGLLKKRTGHKNPWDWLESQSRTELLDYAPTTGRLREPLVKVISFFRSMP